MINHNFLMYLLLIECFDKLKFRNFPKLKIHQVNQQQIANKMNQFDSDAQRHLMAALKLRIIHQNNFKPLISKFNALTLVDSELYRLLGKSIR